MARRSGGFHAGRAEAPAPSTAGLGGAGFCGARRRRSLDLVAPARRETGRRSQPAKRRARRAGPGLARSIATVSLRRLGTIRKALARRLEKGMPKRGGALEWTLVVAAAQILFLDIPDHAAVDLAVKATRAEPASAPFAALANAVLRAIARDRDEISGQFRSVEDETPAWLAQRWRSTYGEARCARDRLGAPLGADARPQRQKRPRFLGRKARRTGFADWFVASRHPCADCGT